MSAYLYQPVRLISILLAFTITASTTGFASPKTDLPSIQAFYQNKFPDVDYSDYANGVYALDPVARETWEALEEFPPYETNIDDGESLWETTFSNGKSYADCFPEGPGVKHLYPHWDAERKTVITLPYAINLCRKQHGEPELDYLGAEISNLEAYMAYQSRGETTNVVVPEGDAEAMAAYQSGKEFYFKRRGQLNFACFQCHFESAGQKLRAETLGPAMGQTTGWPTYRMKWGALGPLHRRYIGCNKQVRAEPFPAQSETYRNLEYFHTHMSNGLPLNGPAVRR